METHVNNSNVIIAKVKPEITQITYVDIVHKNADNARTIKKEENASPVLMAEINADAFSSTGNSFGRDIRIKLDLNDECSYEVPRDQASSTTHSEGYLSDVSTTKNGILKHSTVNDNERYKCKICRGHFKTRNNLLKHMNLHSEEKNRSLRRRCINTNKETHKCNTCKKSFTFKGNLSRHMKTHAGKRNYDCKICAKRFTRNDHLSTHIKTHTGERNHECKICAKFFVRKVDLLEHLKVHTGERNYNCEVCAKCFARKYNMLEHMKSHTGERKYKCAVCGKCFTRKPHLLKHMKMHFGDLNYQCEFCAERFLTNRNLRQHENKHKAENGYVCDICAKRLASKRGLSRHMKTHTKKNYGKKAVVLEHNKTHGTESNEKESLRKVSHDAPSVRKFEKPSIKEPTAQDGKEVDSDIMERKLLRAINGRRFDAATTEETTKRAEILNLWQSLNNEIIIKEEVNIMGTA